MRGDLALIYCWMVSGWVPISPWIVTSYSMLCLRYQDYAQLHTFYLLFQDTGRREKQLAVGSFKHLCGRLPSSRTHATSWIFLWKYVCLVVCFHLMPSGNVGRNLWICAIHGLRCAIYGSLLCAGIRGLRRVVACAIYGFFV